MSIRPLALVVMLAAGCSGSARDDAASPDRAGEGGTDGEEDFGSEASCDCMLVASTCCECPTFAVAAGDDYADACDEVECPEPSACPALEARCEAGACMVGCAPVVTAASCPGGFARDAFGCLLDDCGPAPGAEVECAVAEDCVRVADDCCGCAEGGADTAVASADVAAHEAGLGCTGQEACPGVDTCDDGRAPACVAGRCTLVGAVDDAAGDYCGTPDHPACPEGTVCVLNRDPAADALGVGRCLANPAS